MEIFGKDFEEIFTAEVVSITGGIFAGFLLTFLAGKLYLLPAIFIILPGFLEMQGDIAGSLASRLSSGLFLGAFRPKLRNTKILRGNALGSFYLAIIVSLILGILAYLLSLFIFDITNPMIILVAVIATMISIAIEIPLTILTTFWLFRKRHDPNNIMGPYITTIGDIISIFSLMAAVSLI